MYVCRYIHIYCTYIYMHRYWCFFLGLLLVPETAKLADRYSAAPHPDCSSSPVCCKVLLGEAGASGGGRRPATAQKFPFSSIPKA